MLQLLTDVKRYPVFNRRGDKLGIIDDVILDADGWGIRYAVLRHGGAGEEHKLLGVALSALTLDTENECYIVAVDDDALARAPSLDLAAPAEHPHTVFRSPPGTPS